MGDNTDIEWADATWDFAVGCERKPISESCLNCWARAVTHRQACNPKLCVGGRNRFAGLVFERDSRLEWTGEVRVFPELLDQPLHWRKPRTIFACSRTDVALLPEDVLRRMFKRMAVCHHHTFLLVTKRIAMLKSKVAGFSFGWTPDDSPHFDAVDADTNLYGIAKVPYLSGVYAWPLSNVWVFATVTTQAEADRDLPVLRSTPAAHLGINIEPCLEAIDLSAILPAWWRCPECRGAVDCDEDHRLGTPVYCTGGDVPCTGDDDCATLCENEEPIPLEGCHIESVVFGCESGKNRRLPKCDVCGGDGTEKRDGFCRGLSACGICAGTGYLAIEWARSIRKQCRDAGVAFAYKQGPNLIGRVVPDHVLDGRVEWNLPWRS